MTTKIYVGNALEVLPKLKASSVHCSVTSPPYFGLRKYEGSQQCEWPEIEYAPMPGLLPIHIEAMTCALGHEKSIAAYIGHLVAIYREIYRVVREDSVCWIVMGDSFSSQGGPEPAQTKWQVDGASNTQAEGKSRHTAKGLSQGNLMMVPHRLALALQADGWIVRNDCVFSKVAPMPESIQGWSWQCHRIKVKDALRGKEKYRKGAYGDNPQRDHAPDGSFAKAEYTDCPGCVKCEANDGYVLKRGSARHTRAHETVLHLAKSMVYYSDHAKFKEDVSEVQKKIAASRLLHKQENWAIPFPLQEMPETETEGILLQRTGAGKKKTGLGGGRQGETGRVPTELSTNGAGQGSIQTVRNFGEGQSEESEISAVAEGQRNEEVGPCQTNGEPRLSRTDASLLEACEQTRVSQGSARQVYPVSKRPRGQTKEGQEIQEVTEGAGSGKAVQYSAAASSKGGVLYPNAAGVESDSSNAELSLLLLRREDGDPDPRSYNTSEPRRGTHKREHSGSLPEMQCKKRQQVAKRNPRSVLHAEAEEELYQQFLVWRAEIENGNPPDVLTPKPSPFLGKHFAAFPPSLVEPLIKATCPDKCCPKCGKGWAPTIKRKVQLEEGRRQLGLGQTTEIPMTTHGQGATTLHHKIEFKVLGYRPTCECGCEESISGTVLDPFLGSGTTALVAERLGLSAIGIEISLEYSEMARKRIVGDAPMFNKVEIVEA